MVKLISTGAGHGGRKNGARYTDPGATGNGYEEAYVARLLNNALIAKTGAKDTTDDAGTSVNANLANITAKINACADGYAISNHLNAFNGRATGVEVLYGSADSKPLAAQISKAIANVLGIPDRGAKDGSWLYLAANSGVGKKVLLIEWCFIDNAGDMQKLMANMDKAVQAVADCFDNTVASKPVPAPTPAKKPTPTPTPSATGWIAESGTFILGMPLPLTVNDSGKGALIANLPRGSAIKYDAFRHANGYVWIRQPRGNGYGYMATGYSKNGKRQDYWGTFK